MEGAILIILGSSTSPFGNVMGENLCKLGESIIEYK